MQAQSNTRPVVRGVSVSCWHSGLVFGNGQSLTLTCSTKTLSNAERRSLSELFTDEMVQTSVRSTHVSQVTFIGSVIQANERNTRHSDYPIQSEGPIVRNIWSSIVQRLKTENPVVRNRERPGIPKSEDKIIRRSSNSVVRDTKVIKSCLFACFVCALITTIFQSYMWRNTGVRGRFGLLSGAMAIDM